MYFIITLLKLRIKLFQTPDGNYTINKIFNSL